MYHSKLYSFFLGSLLLLSWFAVASVYSAIKYAYSNGSVQKSMQNSPRFLTVPPLDGPIDFIIDTNEYQQVPTEPIRVAINYEESLPGDSVNDDIVVNLRDVAQTARELRKEINEETSACYAYK